jgi:excisionase family DNA binding protein
MKQERLTFTLSGAAIAALEDMSVRSGIYKSTIVEELILDADAGDTTPEPDYNEADYMPIAQVCTALNVSREYVRQLRAAGNLPFVRRAGRFLYLASAVKALAQKRAAQ